MASRIFRGIKRLLFRLADSDPSIAARRVYLYFWARLVLRVHRPCIVGITGTVGKTTTTECIAAVLMHPAARPHVGVVRKTAQNMNDNAGFPLTVLGYDDWPELRVEWLKALVEVPFRAIALVFDRRYPETLVLEFGAGWGSDVGRLSRLAPPTVAVVTSVGPAHLERFGGIEGVAREKSALVRAVSPDGLVVLGPDNEFASMMEAQSPARVLRVAGRGRALSETIASTVGSFFGIDAASSREALRTFEGAPGRLQLRDLGFVYLIDDVFNANPMSMKLGLDTLADTAKPGQRRVAILGGMAELGEHGPRYHGETGAYARKHSDLIVGVGELAKGYGPDLWFADSRACANALSQWVRRGDCLLMKGSHSAKLRVVVKRLESLAVAERTEPSAVSETDRSEDDGMRSVGQRI
jgi:UDP-N-acetylmuramoyl-tripeptide--D-alanyl-D-alanine ligase